MQFDKDFNPILPNIITLTQGDYREESQTDNLMVMVVCKPNLVHSAPASALSAVGDSSAQKRPTSHAYLQHLVCNSSLHPPCSYLKSVSASLVSLVAALKCLVAW